MLQETMYTIHRVVCLLISAVVLGLNKCIAQQNATALECHVYALHHDDSREYITPEYELLEPKVRLSVLHDGCTTLRLQATMRLRDEILIIIYVMDDMIAIHMDNKEQARAPLSSRHSRESCRINSRARRSARHKNSGRVVSPMALASNSFITKVSTPTPVSISNKRSNNNNNSGDESGKESAENKPLTWWSIFIYIIDHRIFVRESDSVTALVMATLPRNLHTDYFPGVVSVSSTSTVAVMFDCTQDCPVFLSPLHNLSLPLSETSPSISLLLCMQEKTTANLDPHISTPSNTNCHKSNNMSSAVDQKHLQFEITSNSARHGEEIRLQQHCVTVTFSTKASTEGSQDQYRINGKQCYQLTVETDNHENSTELSSSISMDGHHSYTVHVRQPRVPGNQTVFFSFQSMTGVKVMMNCAPRQRHSNSGGHADDSIIDEPLTDSTAPGVTLSLVALGLLAVIILAAAGLAAFVMFKRVNLWHKFKIQGNGASADSIVTIEAIRALDSNRNNKAPPMLQLSRLRDAEEVSEHGSPAPATNSTSFSWLDSSEDFAGGTRAMKTMQVLRETECRMNARNKII